MNAKTESIEEFVKKNSKDLVFRKIKTMIKPKNMYGLTEPHIIRSNDAYELKEIFFSLDNSLSDFYKSGNFKFDNKLSIAKHMDNPYMVRSGNIICGIVINTEKGPYYDKWFICSYKFLTLWTKIYYPNHPSLYNNSFSVKF